ncbi:MAG: TetR/AcrR family transcriptional regulator [Mangrovibacterium sp.]
MAKKKDNSTEDRILEAATYVFIEKGLAGARMQEIADKAEINKALLHYYFRSKDKLFEAIFLRLRDKIIPQVDCFTDETKTIGERLTQFTDGYIGLFIDSPRLPAFIFSEINRDPSLLSSFDEVAKMRLKVLQALEVEMEKGNLIKMDAKHMLVNIISLCAMPFVAYALMNKLLMSGKHPEEYQTFLEERKEVLRDLMLNTLCLKNEN